MNGFSFRGVHSSKFGIYAEDQSRVLVPPRREGKVVIPGRSGYFDAVGQIYDERVESALCTFECPEGKTVPETCREIAYWLSGSGHLTFDKEPDKYYIAKLTGSPPMEQHLRYGQFALTWIFNPPFAFGKTVTQPIHNGENVVDYEGTAETPCTIVLRNRSSSNIVNVTITAVKRKV